MSILIPCVMIRMNGYRSFQRNWVVKINDESLVQSQFRLSIRLKKWPFLCKVTSLLNLYISFSFLYIHFPFSFPLPFSPSFCLYSFIHYLLHIVSIFLITWPVPKVIWPLSDHLTSPESSDCNYQSTLWQCLSFHPFICTLFFSGLYILYSCFPCFWDLRSVHSLA